MLRRLGIGIVWGVAAYPVGAFAGGLLVFLLSSNPHDRELEAAMTGAFVLGPLAATIGFVLGMLRSRPASAPPRDGTSERIR